MGSYRQLTGQQTPPNRPDRVKPVPEHYEGVSFPYRGTESHGVNPPKDIDPEEYYDIQTQDDGPNPYPVAPDIKEEDPIPVRIVQKSSRERRAWRGKQIAVTDQKIQILGRHEKRGKVVIRNTTMSTNNVYIAEDQSVSPYTGFILRNAAAVSGSLDLNTTEEIWAVCDTGETATVFVAYEYSVDLGTEL